LWSIFTALCGAAQNFWQLFLARMGVGVGEAGGVAPSYSLIADLFPPERRARALAIFSFGIPIGSALGIFFGGWIASATDWRVAFLVVGLAGLPVALLLKLGVPEPVRGGFDRAAGTAPEPAPPFGLVMATLARKPSFWLLSFGAASGSILGYGLIFWLPSFFQRSFELSLTERSLFYGSIVLIGGVAGTWFGGWIGDRIGRWQSGRLCAGARHLLSDRRALSMPAALFAPSLAVGFVLFLIPQALGLAWLGPVIAAVQHIVPPAMRATAERGLSVHQQSDRDRFGTWFVGEMSEAMKPLYGNESLRYSILFTLGFYLISSALYFLASRRLDRDWHREA
jgi:MFS family permease